MLDTDTKRRIDTARDILVGKVPDPKSQVEQITIALIYKFMDDMDAESEELGGKRKFFAGPFKKYGWAQLMRSGLGGHETLERYSEAITRMPENPGIPPLFRDIFKNAYLPYRDPETLRAFLKIIDEFNYDHSERLGDAFEYLLSVLGSQGDAGQFRTPRHIIDFMVEITAPQKHETILDPACGTAGFLISAYKHILRNNVPRARGDRSDRSDRSDPPVQKVSPVPLTPDEKAALAQNLTGYDISPDMVRLSLVNLYLHGFTDPHIHEYDTLTSQDRWNEYADVILANPPFMSPKGGIRPHNRFSVQSKRSEVLFVDYMAEHLTPDGRAAIIVPEGIIFQSQTAYKQLRKLLVEEYLIAVVSLPAGVFQPYSGVKTSILVLDKKRARRCPAVAFFKIENDGFGLGAQRRPIEQNDLPAAVAAITKYKVRITNGEDLLAPMPSPGATPAANSPLPDTTDQSNPSDRSDPSDPCEPAAPPVDYLIVPKEKIAANGDYNLSGERYREGTITVSSFPFVSVDRVFRKSEETVLPETLKGPVNYIGLENITQGTGEITGDTVEANPKNIKSLKSIFKPKHILYGKLRPNLNKVWLADREGICSTDIFVIEGTGEKVNPALYAYLFRTKRFNNAVMSHIKGAQLPRIGWSSFAQLQIPLPPISAQQEIVAEIEGYQNVINGARAVLDNYRPHIPIHPDWPMVALGEHFSLSSGGTPSKAVPNYWTGEIPWVSPKDMKSDVIVDTEDHISKAAIAGSATKLFPARTVVCVVRSGILKHTFPVALLSRPMCINQDLIAFQPKGNTISSEFLFYVFKTRSTFILAEGIKPGVTVQSFYNGFFKEYQLPLPPLATQQAIVAEIEAEQALVDANRELIARMEGKIQATLGRVWGEE